MCSCMAIECKRFRQNSSTLSFTPGLHSLQSWHAGTHRAQRHVFCARARHWAPSCVTARCVPFNDSKKAEFKMRGRETIIWVFPSERRWEGNTTARVSANPRICLNPPLKKQRKRKQLSAIEPFSFGPRIHNHKLPYYLDGGKTIAQASRLFVRMLPPS